jgi:phage-related protein
MNMKRTGLTTQFWLATLALTTLIWVAPGRAQSPSSTPQSTTQQNQDDITRREVVLMNTFLDNHPEIAQELQNNPKLIDDQKWVAAHPALQQFLSDHSEVRQAFDENPHAFMQDEDRYQRSQDDITRRDVGLMDAFLDKHPEIAEQLQKNPKLIDDKKWVAAHPALQEFLSDHSEVRSAFDAHPYAFMRDEDRYDHMGNPQGQRVRFEELFNMDQFLNGHPEIAEQIKKNPELLDNKQFVSSHPALQQFLSEHAGLRAACERNPQEFLQDVVRFERTDEITRRELVNMDQFLDSHPEIAQRLDRDPSLIDNQGFVHAHPALQQFLQQHPGVSEAYERNPDEFMRDENHYDHQGQSGGNSDMNRGQVASFHEFLEGHSGISAELAKNPSLATNDEYLQNHTELQSYLTANPEVKAQLTSDPQSFIKSAQEGETTTPGMMPGATKTMPKMPGTDEKK